MNRNTALTEERDREIYRIYKVLQETGGYASASQIVETISCLPAPQFYMDARTVSNALGRLAARRGLDVGQRNSRSRYLVLYCRYLDRVRGGDRRSLEDICAELVFEGAPSFYLSPRMIKKVVLLQREREREELYEMFA